MDREHSHSLVAPWYLWPDAARRPDTPEANARGRGQAPAFQKFDSGDLVNAFLRDPQASLDWDEHDDIAHDLVAGERRVRFTRMYREMVPRVVDGRPQRKLYLPSHNRFYLVVCELHCDEPGFPNTRFDGICDAGIVIRRRAGARREAWVPDPESKDFGAWRILTEETPRRHLQEATLRLCPLRPDPRLIDHPARGRAIYFAVVPLMSGEMTPDGAPRFDDQSDYEIRCFVRRHDPACPRRNPCRCCGGLSFSAPTESYRIAGHFDLVGTSQRPVTVQLPDMGMIAAQTMAPPPGRPARSFSPLCLSGRPRGKRPADPNLPPLPPEPLDLDAPPEADPEATPPAGGSPEAAIAAKAPLHPEREDIKSNLSFQTLLKDKFEDGIKSKETKVLTDGATTNDDNCFMAIPLVTIVASFVLKMFLGIVLFVFNLYFLLALKICIPFVRLGGSMRGKVEAHLAKTGDTMKEFEAHLGAVAKAQVSTDFKSRVKRRAPAGGPAPRPGAAAGGGP